MLAFKTSFTKQNVFTTVYPLCAPCQESIVKVVSISPADILQQQKPLQEGRYIIKFLDHFSPLQHH